MSVVEVQQYLNSGIMTKIPLLHNKDTDDDAAIHEDDDDPHPWEHNMSLGKVVQATTTNSGTDKTLPDK